MPETFVQLPPDGAGKKLAMVDRVQGADTVNDQVIWTRTDRNRTHKHLHAEAAAVTTEALMALTPVTGLVATAAATSHTVSAGKTLRIQQILAALRVTSTARVTALLSLRAVPSGTLSVSSPVVAQIRIPGQAPGTLAANVGDAIPIVFPFGLDLPAGAVYGISQIASATTATVSVSINAFEF